MHLPFSLAISHACSKLSGLLSIISAMVTYNPSVKGWNFPMQETADHEQRKRCHEQGLLNTVSPTVLRSNPAF